MLREALICFETGTIAYWMDPQGRPRKMEISKQSEASITKAIAELGLRLDSE